MRICTVAAHRIQKRFSMLPNRKRSGRPISVGIENGAFELKLSEGAVYALKFG
jgi:hypothetical protein